MPHRRVDLQSKLVPGLGSFPHGRVILGLVGLAVPRFKYEVVRPVVRIVRPRDSGRSDESAMYALHVRYRDQIALVVLDLFH